MVAVANDAGYPETNVSAIASAAGVSKPTFYEYFRDREDCFAAAMQAVQSRLVEEVSAAIADSSPDRAAEGAFRALLKFAGAAPEDAEFLFDQPLGGGPQILDPRNEGLAAIARGIANAEASAPAQAAMPDIPIEYVVGGVYRLLASRLRRGEHVNAQLTEGVITWINGYDVPGTARHWGTLKPRAVFPRSPHVPSEFKGPEALGRGRPKLSAADVRENQRRRIIFAASDLAGENGYTAMTTTEIARRAKVDLRTFYRLFSTKREAFSAMREIAFQETMSVTAGAFFSGASWPERCWQGGLALLQLFETNPNFAHVGLVESYAVGDRAGANDMYVPFMIFMQEGLQYATVKSPPDRVAQESIVATYFEIVFRQVHASRPAQLAAVLPDIAHMYLTPFYGAESIDQFIEEMMRTATETF